MIERVLAICQGPNDIGLLTGLRDRLGCAADVRSSLNDPALRQRGVHLLRTNAKRIWVEAQRTGIHLVVRLTDSDGRPFQQILREERSRFPEPAQPFLVCGVCDPDVEHWLNLDTIYAAGRLNFDPQDLPSDRVGYSSFIKHRIQLVSGGKRPEDYRDFIAQFVREAPDETMRRWLKDQSFGDFYSECVRVAKLQQDCPIRDERG